MSKFKKNEVNNLKKADMAQLIVGQFNNPLKVNRLLCVNIETGTEDPLPIYGKKYPGVFEYLDEDNCAFTQTQPAITTFRRNAKVYKGRYLNCTQGADGLPRFNFKKRPAGLTDAKYAYEVWIELRMALECLVENNSVSK